MKKKKTLLGLALMLSMATILGACETGTDEPVDPGAPAVDPAEAPAIDPAEAPTPVPPANP